MKRVAVIMGSWLILAVASCAPQTDLAARPVRPMQTMDGSILSLASSSGPNAEPSRVGLPAPQAASATAGPSITEAAFDSQTAPLALIDQLTVIKSKPWEQLQLGYYKLVNNVWGAPNDEGLSSGVYSEPNGSFGWYWDRPRPQAKAGESIACPIYPSVRIGGSPWEESSSRAFPVRVGDLRSLTFDVTYGYPSVPTGSDDLAYDVFFADTNQPSAKPVIKAEVMIWVRATATEPADRYVGDFSDGGNTYALYSWVMASGRQYYAFVMKPKAGYEARHVVDAKRLFDGLALQPDWWIHGIEFGSEVWQGSGKIEISQLTITLNGSEP